MAQYDACHVTQEVWDSYFTSQTPLNQPVSGASGFGPFVGKLKKWLKWILLVFWPLCLISTWLISGHLLIIDVTWLDLKCFSPPGRDVKYLVKPFQDDRYVLPLLWRGTPVRMSCPTSQIQSQALSPPSVCCTPFGMTVKVHGLAAEEVLSANGKHSNCQVPPSVNTPLTLMMLTVSHFLKCFKTFLSPQSEENGLLWWCWLSSVATLWTATVQTLCSPLHLLHVASQWRWIRNCYC